MPEFKKDGTRPRLLDSYLQNKNEESSNSNLTFFTKVVEICKVALLISGCISTNLMSSKQCLE